MPDVGLDGGLPWGDEDETCGGGGAAVDGGGGVGGPGAGWGE